MLKLPHWLARDGYVQGVCAQRRGGPGRGERAARTPFARGSLACTDACTQAKTLLQTYNKLVDRLIGQLVERMCQCRRSEEATRATVSLIKTEGTQEQKTMLATQLRALPLAGDYKVS